MTQIFLSIAALFGGLSVAAGAFGAHALRDKISERSLEIFDTGAKYQMYHAIALLLVGILLSRTESPPSTLIASGWLFILGIAIFSGSLYALSLTGIKSLGAIAPLGGAAFIAGWGALAFAAWNLKL
ncbi:DUF423 domain-containing protein [Calothrix sp. FACHB-1219]|uniref:DUF423 domain-containing protein n=1 Tax=unclassified Calothrix TaxID=2619626 RepID=UPI00168623AE|nr:MULTISPECIES: DUF423 domain-containing protein [unclassified Calothrix]MBD2201987.1 DUF423 domain-containing protein [Calothrix sp. FACHB-168]MBD2217023.1 DUF423 domain-containing protein [Calothrix sp. FACHB-1219]